MRASTEPMTKGLVVGEGKAANHPPPPPDTTEPTMAEVMRVRVWTCAYHGHSFDVVESVGSSKPVLVECRRCGKGWHIGDEI